MTVSRANFLKLLGLALAGAGVDVQPLAALCAPAEALATGSAGQFRLQDAAAAMFRLHVTTTFHVRAADGGTARLRLAEVNERLLTKNVEQFSLIFHAPPGLLLPDGIHRFEHAALGRFDLFIVPVGAPNAHRSAYQACFSRLVEDVSHV